MRCTTRIKKNHKNNKRSGTATAKGSNPSEVFIGYRDGFHLRFPTPRLPRILGNLNSLSSTNSVYPACLSIDMPITPQNATVTSGAASGVFNIGLSALIGSTRFAKWAAVFREYCLVGLRLELSLTSTTNGQGFVVWSIDESSNTSPGTEVLSQPHLELPLAPTVNGKNRVFLNWQPKDYEDLEWTNTGTGVNTAYFKCFASTANTFTGATTSANMMITGTVAVCFRGLLG